MVSAFWFRCVDVWIILFLIFYFSKVGRIQILKRNETNPRGINWHFSTIYIVLEFWEKNIRLKRRRQCLEKLWNPRQFKTDALEINWHQCSRWIPIRFTVRVHFDMKLPWIVLFGLSFTPSFPFPGIYINSRTLCFKSLYFLTKKMTFSHVLNGNLVTALNTRFFFWIISLARNIRLKGTLHSYANWLTLF